MEKLYYAAWIGDRSMLETLAQNTWGITNPTSGWTALHSAVWNMHVELVKYLLSFGNCRSWQKKDPADFSLLHFAVRNRDTETLRLLLEAKADINFVDSKGRTALHAAAIWGNVETAKALIAAGAIKEKVDSEGKSPRYYTSLRNTKTGRELFQLL
jgi:ankyrin repeat protein